MYNICMCVCMREKPRILYNTIHLHTKLTYINFTVTRVCTQKPPTENFLFLRTAENSRPPSSLERCELASRLCCVCVCLCVCSFVRCLENRARTRSGHAHVSDVAQVICAHATICNYCLAKRANSRE